MPQQRSYLFLPPGNALPAGPLRGESGMTVAVTLRVKGQKKGAEKIDATQQSNKDLNDKTDATQKN